MKLLSIIIPSYNSEAFLHDCLDSLLIGLDNSLEVIVVNDGSTDRTSQIAHEYASKHSFIKVIDKENGGHGSGINVGIREATGLYFKVLDSDDFLDKDGLLNLLSYIQKHQKENNLPDLYLTDYYSVSDVDKQRSLVRLGHRVKEKNVVSNFDNIKRLHIFDYFMMHMEYVKTSLLKDNNVNVTEHCFYEDNEFLINTFVYANTVCYLDKPIYLYTVNRKGQSISMDKMAKNYVNHLTVLKNSLKVVDSKSLKKYSKGKRRAVLFPLRTVLVLSFYSTHLGYNKEKKNNYRQMKIHFKKKDKALFKKMYHHTILFWFTLIPPFMRKMVMSIGYRLFSKKLGWS